VEKLTVVIPPAVLTAAERLAEVLVREEPIAAFRQAQAEFEADPQAQQVLDQLASAQADLRVRQRDGSVSQADLDHLRDLQRQAGASQAIMGYAEAQQLANDYLLGVNLEISRLIGVDFGALARPARC
jgi:cell fate (sporulation/competence/biofilm development) regulator YlbF (YheA/YmcA/DUF963 family)